MKTKIAIIETLIKDYSFFLPICILFLSLTSFSFHNSEIDLEFNEKVDAKEVELIVDRKLNDNNQSENISEK